MIFEDLEAFPLESPSPLARMRPAFHQVFRLLAALSGGLLLHLGRCKRAGWYNVGALLTVILGLAGVVVGVLSVVPSATFSDLHPAVTIMAAAIGLVAVFFFAGWLALWSLPPDQYAQVVIAGRPGTEVICTIASAAKRLSSLFADATLQLAWRLDRTLDGKSLKPLPWKRRRFRMFHGLWRKSRRILRFRKTSASPPGERAGAEDPLLVLWRLHRDEITDVTDWIRQVLNRRISRIRRLSAMKEQAASQLGISSRRLSDHVFQFSPSMFHNGIQKYLQNWKEIQDTLERAQHGATTTLVRQSTSARLRGLLRQNRRLEEDCHYRVELLQRLLDCRLALDHVLTLASIHSTSGALQAYAAALQVLTIENLQLLNSWDGNTDSQDYIAAEERLLFLRRKQSAHPGFDLHILLEQACREAQEVYRPHSAKKNDIEDAYRADQETVKHQRFVLRLMREIPGIKGRCLLHEDEARIDTQAKTIVTRRLESLARLTSTVTAAVASSRKALLDHAKSITNDWFAPSDGDTGICYLVTNGYSKTVRDLIGACFECQVAGQPVPDPLRIFLLSDQSTQFDVRLMKWELGEAGSMEGRHVAAGPVQLLLGLVGAGDRVLVVVGAECFDSDRRVLHPRGAEPQMRLLLRGLAAKNVRSLVLVVAERFKQLSRPLPELVFSSAHFENVDLYEPELVDLVVTNRKTVPEDHQEVLSKRRADPSRPLLYPLSSDPAA